MIDTQTQLMGLLGKPLGQSFSAAMHTQAFHALSLNCIYLPIESEAEELKALVGGIRVMNFIGFNVTKPYKVEIMQYLDELDEMARVIGAVNTVKVKDGQLIGYNTDGMGFVDSLAELDFKVKGKRFLILGAGGAARAVAVTLAFEGAQSIVLTDLYSNLAEELAQHLNTKIRQCASTIPAGDRQAMKASIDSCDCIINASGVGMYPHPERTPVDKELLRPELMVCDLTYNPEKTQLLLDAQSIGCSILNGLGMLLGQGARAFEIWLERPAPVEVMRKTLLEQINKS